MADSAPDSPQAAPSSASGRAADPSAAGGVHSDIEQLSYEQARDQLVRVVTELEQGTATLEESLTLWERGEALAKQCERWLLGAKARLDAVRGSEG